MRKYVAQTAAATLPLVTAIVANAVTPGYDAVGHTSTILIALITGFGALFAISLNMRDRRDADPGWLLAAGWTLATSLLIVTMMETVILKPGGIDGRQWLPTMALAAIAIAASCEMDGEGVTRNLLIRSAALAATAVGAVLALSLCIASAGGRLSGDNAVTLTIALVGAVIVFGPAVQTQRAENLGRARLGLATTSFVLLVMLTSIGTYAWTPHISPDAVGRQVFQ